MAAVGQAQVLKCNALPEWEGAKGMALIVLVVYSINDTACMSAKGFVVCAAVKV